MSGTPCADCFTGTIHLGTPVGTTATIHGLPVYVAQPPEGVSPKGLVVMITDAFGWEFVNNRLLADNYAKKGNFLVYVPDFMNNYSLPFEFVHIMEDKVKKPASSWFTAIFCKPIWMAQAASMVGPWIFSNRSAICKPRIFEFFQALRTAPPPFAVTPGTGLKIGAAGFCWGGYYTVLLAQDAPSSRVKRHEAQTQTGAALEPLLDCAFTAHPSLLTVPLDIEPVKVPLSVAVGNEDMAMTGPRILQMKDILESKQEAHHQVVVLPGAKHGFAVRVDPEDKLQLEYAEQAEVQAIQWFTKWFA